MTASPSRKNRPTISPMGLSPPTREYAAPPRPSFDSPGKAMHPLSIAPPQMRLSPSKTRSENRSPVKRSIGLRPHQEFMQGIGGLDMAEFDGENRMAVWNERDWNVMRIKQRQDANRSASAVVVRSLSSAVKSLRRRVGSREEQRP